MELDFSKLNLQYLLQARDLARRDTAAAAALLGISTELAALLGHLADEHFAPLAQIKVPLVLPRGELWWWGRLFEACEAGDLHAIHAIVDHASLVLAA